MSELGVLKVISIVCFYSAGAILSFWVGMLVRAWWDERHVVRRRKEFLASQAMEDFDRIFQYNQACLLADKRNPAPPKRAFFPPPLIKPLPGDGEKYEAPDGV